MKISPFLFAYVKILLYLCKLTKTNIMSAYSMEYKGEYRDCVIYSIDIPKGSPIKLHELDVEYIQDDITQNEAVSGSLTVITDDFGIIDIIWELRV